MAEPTLKDVLAALAKLTTEVGASRGRPRITVEQITVNCDLEFGQ